MVRALAIGTFFYLALFAPFVFQSNVIILLCFLMILICFRKRNDVQILILEILLMFLLFSDGYAKIKVDITLDDVTGIYCKVLSEPSFRRNRYKGYKAMILAVMDSNGSISSSSGVVYAITPDSDVHIFDSIFISGELHESIFIAESTFITRKSTLSKARGLLLDSIRSRSRSISSGNLIQLLLVGNGEDSDDPILELSSRAGLRHILALSGMHLSIILLLLRPIMVSKNGRRFAYLLLFCFTWLSGWKASLVRALFFLLANRISKDLYRAFSFSAILLLVFFPHYGFDLGSIYSFVALSGIMLFSMPLQQVLPVSKLSSSIAMSIAAQSTSIPISYFLFGYYQLLSIVFSFPASALISLFMGLSFAYLLIPQLGPLLDFIFSLIYGVFELSAAIAPSTGLKPYLVLISTMLLIVFSRFIISRITKRK